MPVLVSLSEAPGTQLRARDLAEKIRWEKSRLSHQVRRMEQGAESVVQIHFSAQSHRTNNIMRTLTALTAIFLPMTLITGVFGMNHEFMPLLKDRYGFWITIGGMAMVAVVLGLVFWRKRYLERSGR